MVLLPYSVVSLASLLCGRVLADDVVAARDAPAPAPPPVAQVTIGSDTYTYASLVGHGFWSASAQDFVGDTAGGWGSAIAADVSTWRMNSDGSYNGVFYTLPDRGWNTQGIASAPVLLMVIGTIDFQARVHKYILHFRPYYDAGPVGGVQLIWQYVDSLLLSDYRGVPTTGYFVHCCPI